MKRSGKRHINRRRNKTIKERKVEENETVGIGLKRREKKKTSSRHSKLNQKAQN